HMRRLLNQAFFTRIYVEQDYVRVDLAEPFDTLLDASLIATASAEDQAQGGTTEDDHTVPPEGAKLMHVIRQTAAETPAPYRGVGNKKPTAVAVGLNETTLVPSAGFEPATPALGERSGPDLPGAVVADSVGYEGPTWVNSD